MCVFAKMVEHMKQFVEKPNGVFGRFPVCPFAHKARMQDRIHFFTLAWTEAELKAGSNMREEMLAFAESDRYDCILFLHPDQSYSFEELKAFNDKLMPVAAQIGLLTFIGHPDDPFTAGGVRVRGEPCPNIQVVKKSMFDKAHDSLSNTEYYYRLSPAERKEFDM